MSFTLSVIFFEINLKHDNGIICKNIVVELSKAPIILIQKLKSPDDSLTI